MGHPGTFAGSAALTKLAATLTLNNMNALFFEDSPLVLHKVADDTQILFTASDAEQAEAVLLTRLEALRDGGLLVIDFSGMMVSSEAARQLLRRAVRRIGAGELEDRFLVVTRLDVSRYNVEIMLEGEGLTLAERREADPPHLVGRVDPAMHATYAWLAGRGTATAREVQDALGLTNISTATNRLTNLARLGLARRVEQQAVAGGGRQYLYAAVQ